MIPRPPRDTRTATIFPYTTSFRSRIWRTVLDEDTGGIRVADAPADEQTRRVLHKVIAAVREGMETLRFNVSIARITELNNHLTNHFADGGVPREIAEPLVLLPAPLAPHAADRKSVV